MTTKILWQGFTDFGLVSIWTEEGKDCTVCYKLDNPEQIPVAGEVELAPGSYTGFTAEKLMVAVTEHILNHLKAMLISYALKQKYALIEAGKAKMQ